MSASICRLCGLPQVTAGSKFLHIYSTDCVVALKRALADAEAERDRYRAALVSLRDAERAYARARSAEDAAYRATCGVSGDALHHAMLDLCEASGACDAAGDAASAALDAAIAAVEEG